MVWRDPEALGPRPQDPAEAALYSFAAMANRGALHPNDDDRLYEFIVRASEGSKGWSQADIHERLLRYHFSEEQAKTLSERCWNGLCTLRKRSNMERGVTETVS